MAGLRVAPGLQLPIEAVTQTFGILAKRGVGKTYTASVMAEEMAGHGLPFVAVDPIGVWWGLRAAADGQGEGLPIPVLGGDHGDLPLEKDAGEVIADLVVDERVSCVLDLGQFRKGEAIRFMTAFAERLYHRNREPLHLFLDEADAFAPQRTMKGEGAERLLGAIEDIVRRGRARGLGATLITQRPAVLNKNVLTQIETLVVHRIVSPQDRKAIDDWVNVHADAEERAQVTATLATLSIGESWWWSPGWLEILKRVKVRERRTFDSSATPKSGHRRQEPKTLADVDLGALEKRMAETVERKKANDPKQLQRRIRELESEVAKKPTVAEPEVLRVEVPVLPDFLLSRLMDVQGLARPAAAQAASVLEEIDKLRADIESFGAEGGRSSRPAVEEREPGAAPVRDRREPGGQRARRATPAAAPTPPAAGSSSNGHLSGPQQRVLDAIAWLHEVGFDQPSKLQVGFIAGYRVGKKVGGTYGNVLGQLRAEGLIDYVQTNVVLTGEGRVVATPPDIERSTEGLQAAVFARLSEPERRVLHGILETYPKALTKQEAGEHAGYSVGGKIGGTYGNILGRLRSLGLIDYPGPGLVAAEPILFLD